MYVLLLKKNNKIIVQNLLPDNIKPNYYYKLDYDW